MIPNPWDVGSARYLQHLGFPALATTSAGFAFSQGLPDSTDDVVVSRDRSLAHIASITAAVDVPVTADFMSGYGSEPGTWPRASLGGSQRALRASRSRTPLVILRRLSTSCRLRSSEFAPHDG